MNFAEYLSELRAAPDYRDQICHVQEIAPRAAVFADTSEPIEPSFAARLRSMGVSRLYTHQAAAIDAVRRGEHVVVATATASGKTLCYNIPVVEEILKSPKTRALYLYPTKALAQDQQGKLNDLGVFPQVRFATFDGDTKAGERRYVKSGAHIVLSNPDMLHVGILPRHTSWSAFFSNLRFVVIDEIHTYRGVFGAHVAQVMRRLRRICRSYGSDPQFIACSATIANPGELVRAITGVDASVVLDDGAPTGKRTFVFWNPPAIDGGGRRSAHVEATGLFTGLVASGIRNITFAKARKSAELILKYSREVFAEAGSELGGRIMSYRAGYTPEERRAIEQGLFNGDLIGVTATNALELGVDVGGLDATVLTGYPGTIASTWQQAGRAGRSTDEALSVLIGLDDALDQFLMRKPEYFFRRSSEQAVVDPGNRRILGQHLVCAAHELPLTVADLDLFDPAARSVLDGLEEEERVIRRGERWYCRGDDYPARSVNIRSASAESFEIRIGDDGGPLLGTIEKNRGYLTVHEGAIYLHQGETYLVEQMDEKRMVVIVRPAEANYYTEPREVTEITVLGERLSRELGQCEACFGDVVVKTTVLGYRKKQLYTDTVVDTVDLDLPDMVFETEALWFTVPPQLVAQMAQNGMDLRGALHAAEHASIGLMPLLTMCDRWDIGGVSTAYHPDTSRPTVFIYDGYPGGVGIAEAAFPRLTELCRVTAEAIRACPCDDGCPSCVQSPKCGNNNIPLDKRGAAFLLEALVGLLEAAPEAKGVVNAARTGEALDPPGMGEGVVNAARTGEAPGPPGPGNDVANAARTGEALGPPGTGEGVVNAARTGEALGPPGMGEGVVNAARTGEALGPPGPGNDEGVVNAARTGEALDPPGMSEGVANAARTGEAPGPPGPGNDVANAARTGEALGPPGTGEGVVNATRTGEAPGPPGMGEGVANAARTGEAPGPPGMDEGVVNAAPTQAGQI